jgi:hypothetical protein
MTEKSLDKKPVSHAIVKTANVIRLKDPTYLVFIAACFPLVPPFSAGRLCFFSFAAEPLFPPAILLLSPFYNFKQLSSFFLNE